MNVADVAWAGSTGLIVLAVWIETMTDLIRPDRWRSRLHDLAGGALLAVASLPAAFVAAAIARSAWLILGSAAPSRIAAATDHPLIGFVVAFTVWDGLGWVDHWIGHRTRIGWLTHRPHHGGSSFNLTVALRQSPYPLAGIALLPVVALTGVAFETAAVVVAVSNTWQAVIHTQARLPLPAWLERTVMTPATHEIHHDHGGLVNLGPVLTVWDRAAGTFRGPIRRPQRSASSAAMNGRIMVRTHGH